MLRRFLHTEAAGGIVLLVAAVVSLVLANSPWHVGWEDLWHTTATIAVGDWSISEDLRHWVNDGLMAVFFFVVGLEIKRELVLGELRDRRAAAVPAFAAIGGMAVPALLFLALAGGGAAGEGWGIPMATDIAFAVGVLTLLGKRAPARLKLFLLTLAIADDLGAIIVIAIFYTEDLSFEWLATAVGLLLVVAVMKRLGIRYTPAYVAVGAFVWLAMFESGVHATIAGVLLGFTVPVLRADGKDGRGLAEHLEHLVRPISAGIAVPVFAFFAAGVTVGGWSGLVEALTEPVALGIISGLVIGKTVGIAGSSWLLAKFTRARLDDELAWIDVIGMAMLAGIGFTVSLLIGELAFGVDSERDEHVKVGVLVGSLIAALLASVVLRLRNRVYRRICEIEEVDADRDGVPDVFEK